MAKQKEVCYLLQKADSDISAVQSKKALLCKQGYLVITIIEGKQEMENGLREVVQNHFH